MRHVPTDPARRMNEPYEYWETLFDSLTVGAYFVDKSRRILRWNAAAEAITGYTVEEMTGIECPDGPLSHVDASGRSPCHTTCPLRACLLGACPSAGSLYIRHSRGHRIPVHVRVVVVRDRQGLPIGAIELFSDASSDAVSSACSIPFDSAPDRPTLEAAAVIALRDLAKSGKRAAVILLRPDRLDRTRRIHGTAVSDDVLTMIGETIRANALPPGLVAMASREFAVVFSPATPSDVFLEADRLRMLVERSSLPASHRSVRTTVSVGATLLREDEVGGDAVTRAVELLEVSVDSGGGCISDDLCRPRP